MTVRAEMKSETPVRHRPTAGAGWRHTLSALRKSFVQDLDDGRGFLWWPVAAAVGAAFYFAPASEPSSIDLVLAGIGALAALVLIARRPLAVSHLAIFVGLACLGFLHAGLMTRLATHPIFPFERTVTIRGHVVAVEDRGKGAARLLVQPVEIEPRPKSGLPPRVRVTMRGEVPVPGEAVTMLARLAPPMPPPLPGGYDFARVAWFSGVGASGFTYGAVKSWPEAPPADTWLTLLSGIETVRVAAAGRIRAALPGDTGAIAAALIVGDRAGISDATNEAMRIAGVSHVLSISGMHMSLVAAFLFGGIRLMLALIPPLALTLPIKKIAAMLSMLGTGTYFVVSGMDVPAERSMITVAVSLLAILIDRRALSLRVIAVAALVTLVLSPEAVMEPGAQMSFAAVVALMAGLEAWRTRQGEPMDGGDVSLLARMARRFGLWLVAALAATVLAGLATLPMALYHFGRLAPLGMIANLVTEPLVSLLIMPMALGAALMMPLGLEGVPLTVMGAGIDAMIAVAHAVAEWTPGGGLYGRPMGWTMLAVVAGGLWICLWRGRKRWLGLVPVLAGLAFVGAGSPPGLIVAGDGSLALVRQEDGTWHKVGGKGGFMLGVWMAAVGIDPGEMLDLDRDVACDPEACLLEAVAGRPSVSVVSRPLAFGDDCATVAIVVSGLEAPPWCHPEVTLLDGSRLAEAGTLTYEIQRNDNGTLRLRETGRVLGFPRRLWLAPAR
ncbi:ComEC/Rec2 family competence protein [Pleomorphomonas sp. PLEO]|uniref:ComEC/Rec2 family competence protein n=1 Tax=Pleomorphomonas sp. PLEO TaxID=3239306 RepID=UPI00351E3D14